MIRKLTLFLIVSAPLAIFAAETHFSVTAEKRHNTLLALADHDVGSGWRQWWGRRGITTSSHYTMDLLGNPIGGRSQGFAHAGSLGIDFMAHLDRIYGWKGWIAYWGFTWRTGSNLSRTKIGNQFPVAQVYGGETWRLNLLYMKKTFCNGDASFKFGRLQGGDDFLQNPLYYKYVSNAFCGNPIGIFFNTYFTAYPNATWGAYAEWKPLKRLLWKVAIYNANADVNKNQYNGFNFQFKNSEGIQWISEVTYLHRQEKEECGLPGNYKCALYYYTGKFDRHLGGTTRGNYGYYFLIDQMIYRIEGNRGITPFAALLFAPDDRNTFPFFFTSGFVFSGVIPCRPRDTSSFGVAYGTYSSELRQSQRLNNERTQNYEMVIELNHAFHISPKLVIQPDLQYIIHPKGYHDVENALVIGAQVSISF